MASGDIKTRLETTYPSRLALVLDGFPRVGFRRFDEVDRLLDIILNPIYHLSLEREKINATKNDEKSNHYSEGES